MLYVIFVVVVLGGNNFVVNYERNLSQEDCYAIVEEIERTTDYKATCQIQNTEI